MSQFAWSLTILGGLLLVCGVLMVVPSFWDSQEKQDEVGKVCLAIAGPLAGFAVLQLIVTLIKEFG